MTEIADAAQTILERVRTVVIGMDDPLEIALGALLAGGHVLFEDVPGLGKTLAARSLAAAIGLDFRRIQCTPDMLPGDVTGSFVFEPGTGEFAFREGPIFTGLLLADEINRRTPKTQSALLEVMAEYQVTVDSQTYPVPNPFLVIATQNPIEHEGTYNLPEAQIDRFLMRISIGYPDRQSELEIVDRTGSRRKPVTLPPVVTTREMQEMADLVERMYVSPAVKQYIVSIVRATRELPQLRLGVSPRGSVALTRAAQAIAAAEGRPYVTADDVKMLLPYVLSHRMILAPEAELAGTTTTELLDRVVTSVPVPKRRDEG